MKTINDDRFDSLTPIQEDFLKKQILNKILKEMDELRNKKKNIEEPSDYVFRLCEAIVAEHAGYKDRMEWAFLQSN